MTENRRTRLQSRKKVVKRGRRIAFSLVPFLLLVGAVTLHGTFLYNKASEAAAIQ